MGDVLLRSPYSLEASGTRCAWRAGGLIDAYTIALSGVNSRPKSTTYLADIKAALRDPRRRGSDDVAGAAHSIDEEREADAQPVAGAGLLRTKTRAVPLLSYVLVPGDLKKRPSATGYRPKQAYRHALEPHKSRTQTPSSRNFFDDIA